MTPSSVWAIRAAFDAHRIEPPSDALLFALGASAWYRFTPGRAMVGLHPARIRHTLYALNIWGIAFAYLSDHAEWQLRSLLRQGFPAIVMVCARRLEDPDYSGDSEFDYAMLVTAVQEERIVTLQGARDLLPRTMELPELRRLWFRPRPGGHVATFHWVPVTPTRCSVRASTRRALTMFGHNMLHTHAAYGFSGLAALRASADTMDHESLQETLRNAALDGGHDLFRGHCADSLRAAAATLDLGELYQAATGFDVAASLWRELGAESGNGHTTARRRKEALLAIHAHETEAVLAIQAALRAPVRRAVNA